MDGERQVQHDGAPIVARQVICAGGSGDGVFGGLDPHSDCTDGIGQTVLVDIEVRALFGDLGGKQEGMFERAMLVDAEGKLRVELGNRVSAVVDSIDGGTGQVRLRPVVIRTADANGWRLRVTRYAW